MTQPSAYGRLIPPVDWEGDDFTPGAGGKYVTCADTATGRMAYWATNSKVNVDGRQIRARISPRDPNGVTLAQAAQGLHSLTGLTLVIVNMTLAQKLTWLRAGKGLVVNGYYDSVPRAYRFQAFADFNHTMFIDFISHDGTMVRKHDPLNPNIHAYGEVIPLADIKPFINSLPLWQIGYVPLR